MIIVGFYDLVRVFQINGYLPAPFVFNVSDTFMDWYHTAYWANNRGAYPVWNTIYAPLAFIITRVFSNPYCYSNGEFDARDCDHVGVVFIVLSYIVCVVLTMIVFFRTDRSTALFRSIAVLLGGPLLFALERGNTMLHTYIVFVILFGGLVGSRYSAAIITAFMINFKLYLLLPVLGLAAKREWRFLELCGIATLGLYLLTIAIVGAGTPFEIAHNLQVWFDLRANVAWDELLYSTTYSPWLIFDARQYPIRDFTGSWAVETLTNLIVIEIAISRALAFLCVLGAWLYPKTVTYHRIAFFILMESFIRTNPGGYGIGLIVFFVFLEKWSNWRIGAAIVMSYLVSIPTDLTLSVFYHFVRVSWLSQTLVDSAYSLSWGAMLRPGLVFLILWAMAADTLVDIYRASKTQRPALGLGLPAWARSIGNVWQPKPVPA